MKNSRFEPEFAFTALAYLKKREKNNRSKSVYILFLGMYRKLIRFGIRQRGTNGNAKGGDSI